MQGQRPEIDDIETILKEANCRTFACLQAECAPEDGSNLLADGGVQDWKEDPMDLDKYGEEVQAITKEIGGGGGVGSSPSSPAFLHYGIRDMNTAKSIDGLMQAVSELADRIRCGETIYLHCWGGKGRAGLVSACLLIELYGVDAHSALEYVGAFCRMRNNIIDAEGGIGRFCASPETREQKEQVKEYHSRVIDE